MTSSGSIYAVVYQILSKSDDFSLRYSDLAIVTNFCTGVGVRDVITSANFYDSRVRGLSVVGGQILGFSIDLHRRPYNTVALPCECVIFWRNGSGRNRNSDAISGFIACCERCYGQLLSTRLSGRYPAIDRCLLELLLSTD